MQWPTFYPNDCPPEKTASATGEFYRFVENDPPRAKDFRSPREIRPDDKRKNNSDECSACGLSLLGNPNDVPKMRDIVPAFRKKMVAKGTLNATLGLILHSPRDTVKSHHDWWLPLNKEPWDVFHIIDFPQDE